MVRTLIIGAGSAGSVVIEKCLRQPELFGEIHIAARNEQRLSELKAQRDWKVTVHACDADEVGNVVALLRKIQPKLLIHMALPYQDLAIMEACLATGVHYMDTANYEPKDKAEFCYGPQWEMHERFKEKGLMALLGAGFDPGVTNMFCAYANKHLFDDIHAIDIIDCNAGDHGHPFATNFNPEINIREITQEGKYWKNGEWVHTGALDTHQPIFFPEVGHKEAYLMYHEEIESLVKHIPGVQQIRFWMTFSESYLTHLRVLESVGMTGIKPISFQGSEIVPLEFLKVLLPNPSELGENYTGKTSIGCVVSGLKDGQVTRKIIYNVCEHQVAYQDCKAQAVGYTTGVPASVAAGLIMDQTWFQPGVVNIEQLDPDPFLDRLAAAGLPWQVSEYAHDIA